MRKLLLALSSIVCLFGTTVYVWQMVTHPFPPVIFPAVLISLGLIGILCFRRPRSRERSGANRQK